MIGVLCTAIVIALAQAPAERPRIDVSVIKPNTENGKPSLRFQPGGRAVATNATLKFLIEQAYGIRDYQVAGGPKWAESTGWDIVVKPVDAFRPDFSTRAWGRQMIQTLLEDRFRLTIRRSTRDLPGYALVPAETGAKLIPRDGPVNPTDMKMGGGSGLMIGHAIPVAILAESLSEVVGRPVADATGLTGVFDFRLEWTPDDTEPSPDAPSRPSIFTAVREQLGLRLEPRKSAVEILNIESASPPDAN